MSAIVRPARAERNPHPVLRYSVALASVAVALVIRLALHPSIPGTLPFATFFVAVAVSAAFGGRGPAILAMVSGYLIGQYFFIPPTHQFALEKFSGPNLASFGLYVFVALTIVFLSHLLRKAKRQAEGSLLQAREKERALEQEVSRRQRVEEALREKEWQLRSAVDGAQLGTWVWDAHAGTVIGNDAMYQMLEIPRDARDPMEIGRSRLDTEDLEELRRRLAEGLKNRRMELGFRVNVPVGGTRWLRIVGEVMEEGQRPPRMAGVAMDVSKQKEVEVALQGAVENLAEAKKVLEERVKERTTQLRNTVAELEAFSYSLSHDMRAPLRAIYSFTNATLEEYGKNIGANGRQFLSRVINSARRMDNLIQDVLNFSRISRHEVMMRPVHLEKLIPDIIYDRPELQPPNAEIEIASPLLPLLGDKVSLTQCLANLLGNAVKFVAPGVKPRVKIWTELRHDKAAGPRGVPFLDQSDHSGQDFVSMAGNRQAHVRLWVEDNGIGIRAESQRKVFGLFQRVHIGANYEGTGLGLAIVRKAVERMGGEAGVQSEFGSGSQFWIQLPLGEGEEPSHNLSATESSTEHNGVGDEAQLKPA